MRFYINFKLAARINLVVTITVAAVMSIFACFIIRHTETRIKEMFIKQGSTFTLNLAYNCEYGLLTGSIEDLTKLLNGAFQEEEILYGAVLDVKKEIIAFVASSKIKNNQKIQQQIKEEVPDATKFDFKIIDHSFKAIPHFCFIATVYSSAPEPDEEDILSFGNVANSQEAIGQVFLYFTFAPLYKELFFDRCMLITAFSMVVLIVSIMIMLLSKKLVINPLASALKGINAVEKGNLDYQLHTNRKDEFGELVAGFNEMTKSMKLYTENFRLEKEFSEELIQSQMDLVIVVDKSGMLTKVNRATLALLNYSEKEVIGKPASFILGSDMDSLRKGTLKTLDGKSIQNSEIIILDSNSVKIPISYNGAPLKDGKGKVTGTIGVGRDLRKQKKDRKLLENYSKNLKLMVEKRTKELRQKDTMLIQSGKLAALGEMATGIAHEINQPLNVIKMTTTGMLYFLGKGKTLPQEMLHKELASTDRQVERIRKIIDHLRVFSRKSENIETEEVDINISLKNSLIFVSEQLRLHQIEVEIDYAEFLPKVMADSNKLEQVFLNILSNARDAMDEKENLDVGKQASKNSKGKEYKKILKICSFVENGNAVAAISDTGGGIPKDVRSKIFEPFFTTKEVGKGTGLGMSISYNIIKEFKGSLNFEVEEEVGTTFYIKLPIKKNQNIGEK